MAIGLLERLFHPRPLRDFAVQAAVGALQLFVGVLERDVERLQLAAYSPPAASRWRRPSRSVGLLQLAALAVQLDQHRDLAAQDLRHHRDGNVVDRADLVALEAVELADVHAGDEDDRCLLEARVIVNQPRRLEAVHVRHAHIQQHDGELRPHELLERFDAGAGPDEVLPELAQHRLVGEQPSRLVVDQQDVYLVANTHGATGSSLQDRQC